LYGVCRTANQLIALLWLLTAVRVPLLLRMRSMAISSLTLSVALLLAVLPTYSSACSAASVQIEPKILGFVFPEPNRQIYSQMTITNNCTETLLNLTLSVGVTANEGDEFPMLLMPDVVYLSAAANNSLASNIISLPVQSWQIVPVATPDYVLLGGASLNLYYTEPFILQQQSTVTRIQATVAVFNTTAAE
jgi:hypothetical protein